MTNRQHIDFTADDLDGIEHEYHIEGWVSEAVPAKIFAPMEDCFPEEPAELVDYYVTHDGAMDDLAAAFEERIATEPALFDEIEQLMLECD